MSLYGQKRTPDDEAATVPITAVTLPVREPGSGDERPPAADTITHPGHDAGFPAPADDEVTRPDGRRTRLLLVAGALAVVVLATLGLTAAYAYRGDIPPGSTVLGVEIGGRSREDAVAALRSGLAQRPELAAPVPVRLGEQDAQLVPSDIGLRIDEEATVDAAATDRPSLPARLLGSRDVAPVVTVDPAALDAHLRQTLGDEGRAATLPAITFTGTTPTATYPKPSLDLDADQSARAVRDGWLGGRPIEIPLVATNPATSAEEVDRLLAELARPAVAAPVRARTDEGTFTISPAAIARSLLLTPDSAGRITPRVDEKRLVAALRSQIATVQVKPRNATIALVGGQPKITDGALGRELDTAALARDLLTVLPRTDGREVTGVLKDVRPETTAEDIRKLGIRERVSTFTTHFTGGASSPRSQNIMQAAREVDGALVKPGKVFSLNGHTGPRTYASGYQDAPVIVGGKLQPGVGGGVSQFTTTLFNASYYAGLEDVEHKPHSYYFSRYPAVIESTIFYPDLDFKFRNNTPYGVMIDTSYTSSSITVSMWSTKIYDSVTTEWSPRRAITRPKVVHLDPGPKCIETDGINGFTQDAWRIFRKDGKVIKREKFSWTYAAEPRFICKKKRD